MGRVADLAVGYPGYCGPHPARERLPLRDPARRTATRRTRSASGTSRPTTRRTWPRRARRWPLGRGFDRWYGFHGGETHQFVPVAVPRQPLGAAARASRGRLPPERRSRRPRDRVPRRPARGRRRPAVLLLLRDRRVPLAASRAAGVDRALPRPLRRAVGTCGATRRSRARSPTGVLPGGHAALAAPALGAGVGRRSKAEDQRGRGALHGVLRRVPLVHRRADRPAARVPRPRPATSTTRVIVAVSDNGASAEGGPKGSINDGRLVNGAPRGPPRAARAHRRDRRPDRAQQLPVGLDDGRQHAVQALEARGARGRRRRPVHRVAGRRHRRRAAGSGASSRTRSTCCPTDPRARRHRRARRRSTASRSRASTARASRRCSRDADAPEHARDAVLRDARLARRSTTDGWKAVTFHPLGAMYDDGLDPDAPFDDDVWELYDVVADPSETNDLAAAEPERLAAMIDLWWDEARAQRRAAARQPAAVRDPEPAARRRDRRARRYVYYPNGAPVPEAVAVNVRNRVAHDHRRRRPCPTASSPRARCSRSARCSAASRCSCVDGRLRYVHNLYGARARRRRQPTTCVAPGRARGRVRVHEDRGVHRDAASCASTARVVGAGDIPHFTPMTFSYTGGGLTCGYEVGPAVGDDYDAPFRANVDDRPRRRRRLGRAAPRSRGRVRRDHVGAVRQTHAGRVRADHRLAVDR